MATTAVVLSATLPQRKQGSGLVRKPLFSRLGCCQNGFVCSSPQHAHLHCIHQNYAGAPGKVFLRRESIALLLQISLLCAPSGNAHAAESVFVKEDLKIEGISDGTRRPRLMSKLCLAELSGSVVRFVKPLCELQLAYLGAPKTSSSSLGFLGCLVFGLLFWREKQATAANAAYLEDVQLCMQKAETLINSQTRSSIGYKLQESQLHSGNESDLLQHDGLKHQILSVKSSISEKEAKLSADKDMSEALKQQVRSLTASVEKIKKDCSSLMAHVDNHPSSKQGLEADIQSVDAKLKRKGEEISSLTIAAPEREKACNELRAEYVAVENSLDMLDNKVLDLQSVFENLKSTLHASNGTAELSLKDLSTAATRNETLEAKFNEFLRSLQFERASSERIMAEQNELLTKKEKEVDVLFQELKCQHDKLDREVKRVMKLTSDRDELDKLSREKKNTTGDLQQALISDLESVRILETEMSTLHQKLRHEQARNAGLELTSKENTALGELIKISSELEGQLKTERKLTEQLENELQVAHETLHSLRVDVLYLHDSIQSIWSSQAHLQEDLAMLAEAHKAHSQALKREKRAAAYARKQLTLTTKTMTSENQVKEELHNELEKVRNIMKDSKLQALLQVNQLEQAVGTTERLAYDILALRTALSKEQTQQMHFSEKTEVSTTVAKPSRRGGMSKPSMPKSRRN